jgi:hypothetical protein
MPDFSEPTAIDSNCTATCHHQAIERGRQGELNPIFEMIEGLRVKGKATPI